MEAITDLNKLPYPIELVREVAEIRFEQPCQDLKLHEAIIMCNLIRGMCQAEDHYVLMGDSIEIFTALVKHGIKTFNNDVDEFKLRKENRITQHRQGYFTATLGSLPSWYCDEHMLKVFGYKI